MPLIQDVLQQLGVQSGLAPLTFDDSGLCQLRVDDLKLALYDNPAQSSLTLLCELPGPASDAAVRWALSCQFKALHEDMPLIGLNPQSHTLVAMRHVPLSQLSLERLNSAIAALVDWARHWPTEGLTPEPASESPRPRFYV